MSHIVHHLKLNYKTSKSNELEMNYDNHLKQQKKKTRVSPEHIKTWPPGHTLSP